MVVLIVQIAGVVTFVATTAVVAVLLRRRPEAAFAQAVSRASHLAFWLGLAAPWPVGLLYPGPTELDRLAGVQGLPLPLWARILLGAPLLVSGVVLMRASMAALGRQGRGAAAFKLTETVVSGGVYAWTRNPMALGYYSACVGGALLSGSTYMLLYTVLGVVVPHLANLLFFEELELSLRHGQTYEEYRRSTPFLVPRPGPRRVEPR